jgi:ligand-binding SRPBCC domain-containing protein
MLGRIAPDSKAGDYSDVLVSTPFGEIPWPKLSRFDDEEMKALMIDVVQKTYTRNGSMQWQRDHLRRWSRNEKRPARKLGRP